jgi:hypothetical protein
LKANLVTYFEFLFDFDSETKLCEYLMETTIETIAKSYIFVTNHVVMKSIFSLLLFTFIGISVNAQREFTFGAIQIRTTTLKCTDANDRKFGQEYEILHVKNTSNSPKVVTYHIDAYYGENCATCTNEEYTYTLMLQPNQEINGTFKDAPKKGTYVFKKDYNGYLKDELTDLKFSNVVVK